MTRTEELATIERWIADHGVTACPAEEHKSKLYWGYKPQPDRATSDISIALWNDGRKGFHLGNEEGK